MFKHHAMCTGYPKDKKDKSLTPLERELIDVIDAFEQLQKDRERADYDSGWKLVETEVRISITRAEDVFAKWRNIRGEDIARHHLLKMFGAKRGTKPSVINPTHSCYFFFVL